MIVSWEPADDDQVAELWCPAPAVRDIALHVPPWRQSERDGTRTAGLEVER